ncbi:MAG: NUDIX hydrolase [Methylobacterium mesophilicum]|nr:NUDIX hydrolase [Methylobacterium mesophilicum]
MSARIAGTRVLHKGWTTLLSATVRLADGSEFAREIEDHGNAVALLPYDPARRVAFLVRQLRIPPLYKGFPEELLEVPAGIMDEPDPADAARREAMEEIGLRIDTLEKVTTAWASPGVSCELMTLFLAPCSAADRVAEGGGLAEEHEGITVVEMPLDEVWKALEDGRLKDMKSLVLVHALRFRRPELFVPA